MMLLLSIRKADYWPAAGYQKVCRELKHCMGLSPII
ncbi:hypothetical protein QFZ70_000746 [Arthrobacter sp. V1I9]|nr:hypothetical protein [Arthrobacter sp. V1I9]